jgi:hypothetical protein
VRDNDRAYGQIFTARIRAMGIRDRPITPGSPWQNGTAERLIGTLRCECLDQLVVFGEGHLRRVLSGYAAYYNKRVRIGHYGKTRRSGGPFNASATLSPSQSSVDCITIRPDIICGMGRPSRRTGRLPVVVCPTRKGVAHEDRHAGRRQIHPG